MYHYWQDVRDQRDSAREERLAALAIKNKESSLTPTTNTNDELKPTDNKISEQNEQIDILAIASDDNLALASEEITNILASEDRSDLSLGAKQFET